MRIQASFQNLRMTCLGAGAVLCALAACDSTRSGHSSALLKMGDYDVSYSALTEAEIGSTGPLTPLLFTFRYAGPSTPNGVTAADLKREAKRLGLDMKTMRIIYGPNPYKDADGTLHVCTVEAVRQRLCKAAPSLPLDQRITYAKALLSKDPHCNWAGFDAAYHKKATFSLGGDNQTLNIKAAC